MARIRTIKPEFWTDEKLAPLSTLTRLTFLGLVSMADDAGRLNDSVKLLDGMLFSETDDTCESALDELEAIGVIARGLSSSGRKIIQIIGWLKHQKIEKANLKSSLPEISTTCRGGVADDSPTRRNLPPNVRRAILEHDDYKCCECGVVVIDGKQDRYDSRDNLAEIDHIVALADGGTDEPENMRTLCKKCNRRKQGRELTARNRRLLPDASPTLPRQVDDMSPPRPTTYDHGSTTYDHGSTTYDHGSTIVDHCANESRTSVEPGASPSRSKSPRFTPPTLEEVRLYCDESAIAIDAELFFDHYSAQGWKLSNGRSMVDWKAAARKWARRDESPKQKTFAQLREENTKRAMEDFANGR